jgi:hypothetical protein
LKEKNSGEIAMPSVRKRRRLSPIAARKIEIKKKFNLSVRRDDS